MQVSSYFQEIDRSNERTLKKLYDYKKFQVDDEQKEADDIIKTYKKFGGNGYASTHHRLLCKTFKRRDIRRGLNQGNEVPQMEKDNECRERERES